MTVLEVRDVGKAFVKYRSEFRRVLSWFGVSGGVVEKHWVLRNIDFAVKAGDSIALIGSNGAGKSTLLKLIAGILKVSEGSIQSINEIPEDLRKVFRTAWELPQKALIDMAAARGPYIDQSQSLNLFIESPTIGKLSSMYMYAWKSGLKTTYYLRSRPATKIAKTTLGSSDSTKKVYTEAEALACSLENPEACEACT